MESKNRTGNVRNTRPGTGGTVALIVACTAVVSTIALVFIILQTHVGGFVELQHATDSGNLNVAKEAIALGVPLGLDEKGNSLPADQTKLELNNFSGLVDSESGMVNLRTYNRIFGQCALVAMNARAEDTDASRDNAERLCDDLNKGAKSISGRLQSNLADSFNFDPSFSSTSKANGARMLGKSDVGFDNEYFAVSYLERDDQAATNVFIDPAIFGDSKSQQPWPKVEELPGTAASAVKDSSNNNFFLRGYNNFSLSVRGKNLELMGVPVHPQLQPHLVSKSTFKTCVVSPASAGKFIPSNTFQCGGLTSVDRTAATGIANSCAIVSSGNTRFSMSIPRGYIRIDNPAGYVETMPDWGRQQYGDLARPGTGAPADSIFNNELYTNIFLGATATGSVVAFSTDPDVIDAWIAYNQNPQSNPRPAYSDDAGNYYVYAADGTVADITVLRSITRKGAPTTGCDVLNTAGNPSNPTCAGLLPSFMVAYPHDIHLNLGQPHHMIAVEAYKNELFWAWLGLARDPRNWFQASAKANVKMRADLPYSGLRVFDHNAVVTNRNPFPECLRVSRPGTVDELLTQSNGQPVKEAIKQRIHEIKPEATDAEIKALFASVQLELGSSWYVFMENQTARTLKMTNHPPTWVRSATNPDGSPQEYKSEYTIINKSVNGFHDFGLHDRPFLQWPNPNAAGKSSDIAIWTPSSGYDNLLGVLEFRNVTKNENSNGDQFSAPN